MIGSFGFLSPWILVALAALPLIWLILRLTPPRPRQVKFPPTRILLGLQDRDRTPARTPWWLTALRLLLVALIIGALAEPVLRPDLRLTAGTEPLLVVIDNGWDAAPDFADRIAAAETAMAEAARDGRPVSLLATAETRAEALAATDANAAASRLGAIVPRPYLPDRAAAAERLAGAFGERSLEVLWLAGALDGGDGAALATAVNRIAARGTMVQSARPLTALKSPENAADAVRVPVARIGGAGDVTVAGFDAEGRRIVEGAATLGRDGTGIVEIALPTEIRNSLVRFVAAGEDSAGAVQLLDGSWRRKSVGLIVGETAGGSQPLLEPLTYVERALAPSADLIRSDAAGTSEAVAALIDRGASIIILTETGTLPPDTTASLVEWVEAGGTLLRFASPNLAATAIDALLPVRLRQGEREIGGSLSWEEPQPIGSFPAAGPFAGIEVPADVRVNRQVLADPEALRDAEVWAELRDGTPLVTARAQGSGRIVLFHVTADPRWSNLPISGAFVEMLNTIVDTAGAVTRPARGENAVGDTANAAESTAAPWRPLEVLDGAGKLGPPDPSATLVADIAAARASAETPPGIYDRDGTVYALNTVERGAELTPLTAAAIGWQGRTAALEPRPSSPIWPWLLAAAALLAILDGLAVLALSGRLTRRFAPAAALALAFALLTPAGDPARAQEPGAEKALAATTDTQLAYVITGNSEIDETSRAGLEGLSLYLSDRTALEPGKPAPIDVNLDELAFYALIYWPIDPDQPAPSGEAMAKVDTFLKNGGTILFDTRDAGGFTPLATGSQTPENLKLREILAFVDVPPLEPVPPDHVLTKAFYLLSGFPGRWDNSDLWVETLSDTPQDADRPARGGDGVSPILITGNDLTGAWAIDAEGLYLYPTVPGDARQRELSFRAGVNIVMYALTGNYKADQVHVPALLERLGQ
ncbi:MAG: DUF4159 domain-containing protein [Rhizobiales bacterium]|nr:DUF4159 domain-containing protein [Hyphomicrobiales bacterium]